MNYALVFAERRSFLPAVFVCLLVPFFQVCRSVQLHFAETTNNENVNILIMHSHSQTLQTGQETVSCARQPRKKGHTSNASRRSQWQESSAHNGFSVYYTFNNNFNSCDGFSVRRSRPFLCSSSLGTLVRVHRFVCLAENAFPLGLSPGGSDSARKTTFGAYTIIDTGAKASNSSSSIDRNVTAK